MKILERNYQSSLQAYMVHEDTEEARNLLKRNLLSRLSLIVGDQLNQQDKIEKLIPNIEIKVIKICNNNCASKPLFLGGLNVSKLKFPTSGELINPEIENTFRNSGVDLPTSEFLDKKLDRVYSSGKYIRDPFNMNSITVTEVSDKLYSKVTDKEYSEIENSIDRSYSINDDRGHFKTLKSISLLAMHKFISENPDAPKERLERGVENLTKDIPDLKDRQEIKSYLLEYINRPSSRPLLVKESELIIKGRTPGINIPLWVVMSIIGLALVGTIVYTQRDSIKAAWKFSDLASKFKGNSEKPSFSRKKSFFKSLFTKSGRDISKNYLSNLEINEKEIGFLKEVDLLKRESEVRRDRSKSNMELLMEKFYKK